MNEMYSVTEREAFFYGFRLGVRLMAYLKAGRRLDSYSHSKNALVAFFVLKFYQLNALFSLLCINHCFLLNNMIQ